MDINEAKKILEKYDYDWKEIEDNNADKDFKKFNVPKETVQQWYLEGYKKRIFDFKSKFLSGEDASRVLWSLYHSFWVYVDDAGFVEICNTLFSNINRLTPELEINYYIPLIGLTRPNNYMPKLSVENKNKAISFMKERLSIILESNPVLQQKYQHLYNTCESRLNNIRL